ncbi:MAG: GNAT family N-acetyltransferase [Thermoplasmata archaeon]
MAIIRDAVKGDLEPVNHILKTNGQINDVVKSDIKDFVVAEVDSKVVGLGMLKDHEDYVEIRKVSVLSEYRKRGIGKKIAHTLLGRAEGKKCSLLSVDSHSFWEQFGFYMVSEKEEPRKIREQCDCCSQRQDCNRVVMFREEVYSGRQS